jgi:hypothetical protein
MKKGKGMEIDLLKEPVTLFSSDTDGLMSESRLCHRYTIAEDVDDVWLVVSVHEEALLDGSR